MDHSTHCMERNSNYYDFLMVRKLTEYGKDLQERIERDISFTANSHSEYDEGIGVKIRF